MRTLVCLLAPLLVIAGTACSSGGGCKGKKFCSADPDAVTEDSGTSAEVICEHKKCGDLYDAFLSCVAPNVKCTAENKTDTGTLIVAYAKCGAQLDKYNACVNK